LKKQIPRELVYCMIFFLRINLFIYKYYRLRKFEINLDNSSLSLNETDTNLSQTSTSILLLLLILSFGICGICCFCKKKSNNVDRSSEDSEYSQETLQEIFIE